NGDHRGAASAYESLFALVDQGEPFAAHVPTEKVRYARLLIDMGEKKRAETILRGLCASAPEAPDVWQVMAELAHADGRLEEAVEWLRRGCNACPGSSALWLRLGLLLQH